MWPSTHSRGGTDGLMGPDRVRFYSFSHLIERDSSVEWKKLFSDFRRFRKKTSTFPWDYYETGRRRRSRSVVSKELPYLRCAGGPMLLRPKL